MGAKIGLFNWNVSKTIENSIPLNKSGYFEGEDHGEDVQKCKMPVRKKLHNRSCIFRIFLLV